MPEPTDRPKFCSDNIKKKPRRKFDPYMTVNNRNGMVFIRIVYMSRLGRETKMVRIDPDKAEKIGNDILKCVKSARKTHPPLKLAELEAKP